MERPHTMKRISMVIENIFAPNSHQATIVLCLTGNERMKEFLAEHGGESAKKETGSK